MNELEKIVKSKSATRREFLKITGLAIGCAALFSRMMCLARGSFALFEDIETSIANKAYSWVSAFHTAFTKTAFETGELFFVDTASYPGNVVLSQARYIFAPQGGGSTNDVYRFNRMTLVWEPVSPVPDGSPVTYIGNGGGIAYPGTGNHLYCLKGNSTSEFYRYDISTNSWEVMAPFPVELTTGGYLSYAKDSLGNACLYAFQGGSSAFYRYNIGSNSWTAMASTIVGATTYTTGAGVCITWDRGSPGYLYATMGGSTNTFLRYDISAGTWSAMAPVATTSGTVGAGGSIAYVNIGTAYVYAMQGNNTNGFYRYNIGANTWSTMTVTPGLVNAGGSMRWDDGGYLVVLQGATTTFWRYDLVLDTWGRTIAPLQVGATNYPVSAGGAYTSGNDNYDYAFTGGTTNYFLRYDKLANTWALMTSPGSTGAGASLVYTGGNFIYAFAGGNAKSFWRYDISANSWSSMSEAPVAVTNGASLVWTGGNHIYATFGNTKTFQRYNIASVGGDTANTWTSILNSLGNSNNGGSLAWDKNNFIYFMNGQGTGFERYSISANTWASLSNVPGNVNSGGSLAYPFAAYAPANALYATRGAGTVSFYKYSPSIGTWSVMANVPSAVGIGGSLCDDEDGYIHCITGGGTNNHWRYNVAYNTWIGADTLTPYPGNTGAGSNMSSSVTGYNTSGYLTSEVIDNSGICEGGAMAYDGTYIYGTTGDMSTSLRRYSISGNSWELLRSIEHGTGWGADACSDKSAYIFVITGENTNHFWRYSTASDTWQAMADTPEDVYWGGALVYVPTGTGYIYAYQGNTTAFWKYDVAGNAWSSLAPASGNTGRGASLVYDGSNYIYGTLGGGSTGFRRYDISSDSWQDMAAMPELTESGGRMAYPGSGDFIYSLQGGDKSLFYRYNIPGNTWTQLSSAPMSVFDGGYLVAGDSGYLYAYRGRDTTSFWRYSITIDDWDDMASTPAAQFIRLDGFVWNRNLPAGTSMEYYMRSSDTLFSLSDSSPAWGDPLAVTEVNSGNSSAVLTGLGYHRYAQVKVVFNADYINVTPLLSRRTVYFYRWF